MRSSLSLFTRNPYRRGALALAALLVTLAMLAAPASAYWIPDGHHIGYYSGTTSRKLVMYDETGDGSWMSGEGAWAQDYLGYWVYWAQQHGVPLPYLDYHTSGGLAGCDNDYQAVDVCVGNPGNGNAALATYSYDINGHVTYATVTVLPSYNFNSRQREAIMCQEVSHVFGLDHNPYDPSSCMYPVLQQNPGIFYDAEDDTSMRNFYSGHQP